MEMFLAAYAVVVTLVAIALGLGWKMAHACIAEIMRINSWDAFIAVKREWGK